MRNEKEKENQQKTKRTSPRRAKKDPNEAPVFLKKCFQMINEAPAEVAGWSESGDSFLVKDTNAFSELLPRFYKHKNFTSFVRQLNFYGFRKLRADDASSFSNPQWWGFRHEKFRRGQHHLLRLIKRSSHFETPDQDSEGTEELKIEVFRLRDRVEQLQSTIDQLTKVTNTLLSERNNESQAGKKRRFDSSADFLSHPVAVTTNGELRELKEFADDEILDSFANFSFDEPHTLEMLSQLSIDTTDMADFDLSEDAVKEEVIVKEEEINEGEVVIKEETKPAEWIPSSHSQPMMMQVPMPDVAPYLAAAALGAAITQLASSEAALLPNHQTNHRTMTRTSLVS